MIGRSWSVLVPRNYVFKSKGSAKLVPYQWQSGCAYEYAMMPPRYQVPAIIYAAEIRSMDVPVWRYPNGIDDETTTLEYAF